ncbi:MAG: hypothetical protein K0S55_2162 [Clostridia bacterium]|jgi:hypothetical protein|nr:hypothetical protein [Clostridia bacterium]
MVLIFAVILPFWLYLCVVIGLYIRTGYIKNGKDAKAFIWLIPLLYIPIYFKLASLQEKQKEFDRKAFKKFYFTQVNTVFDCMMNAYTEYINDCKKINEANLKNGHIRFNEKFSERISKLLYV